MPMRMKVLRKVTNSGTTRFRPQRIMPIAEPIHMQPQ